MLQHLLISLFSISIQMLINFMKLNFMYYYVFSNVVY